MEAPYYTKKGVSYGATSELYVDIMAVLSFLDALTPPPAVITALALAYLTLLYESNLASGPSPLFLFSVAY